MQKYLDERGQIAFIAAIFLVMAGMFLFTRVVPGPASEYMSANKNLSSSPPPFEKCQNISDPTIVFTNVAREYAEEEPQYKDAGEAEYKLIRKGVPLPVGTFFKDKRHSEKKGVQSVNGVDFELYYPKDSGEIYLENPVRSPSRGDAPTKPGSSRYGRFYFIDWGLVFLVNLNAGAPVSFTYGGEEYYVTDIYQNAAKPAIPEEAFKCIQTSPSSLKKANYPTQSASLNKQQLQLEYFLFNPDSVLISEVDCKPAVYLYPKEKTLINVRVEPKGILSYTDPKYDPQSGWTVWAYPDGTIETRNSKNEAKNYTYLYYESKLYEWNLKKPQEGFVVKYEELKGLFDKVLPRLGLNKTHADDFSEYWIKALPYSRYYFVGFLPQEHIDEIEKLKILPKPDQVLRVRAYFEALDEPKAVEPPQFTYNLQPTNLNIFRVVDWGGMVKREKDSQFTCLE